MVFKALSNLTDNRVPLGVYDSLMPKSGDDMDLGRF